MNREDAQHMGTHAHARVMPHAHTEAPPLAIRTSTHAHSLTHQTTPATIA